MVEPLDPSELPSAIALLERVGLAGAVASVARYLRWQPDGAWCVRDHGALAGMVTLLRFGQVGFVGCMAVEPAAQGRGLGRRLLEHAHAAGRRAGITTFLLEATAAGVPLYEKLGYLDEHETWNVTRPAVPDAGSARSAGDPLPRPTRDRDPGREAPGLAAALAPGDERAAILELDRRATGSPRDVMIDALVSEHRGAAVRTAGGLVAYGLRVETRIGPVVACDPGAGRAVIDRLAARSSAPATVASVPVANEPAMAAFAAHGFTCWRSLRRMRLGPPVARPAHWIWSLASPGAG